VCEKESKGDIGEKERQGQNEENVRKRDKIKGSKMSD
jgi:hypothetical protein